MNRPRILVVDDVPENLFLIQSILDSLDVDVDCAGSGEEALNRIGKHHYGLILLDISMPGMNGFECAREIRLRKEFEYIPIIFLTAYSDDQIYVEKGYELGAVDYLIKPVHENILTAKVKTFIELELRRNQLQAAIETINSINHQKEQIINYAAEGIIGLDNNNVVIFANYAACELLEQNKDELLGKNIKDIIFPHASESEWDSSPFAEQFCSADKKKGTEIIYRNEKASFPVDYVKAPIYSGGECVGGMLAFQDVSERIEKDERLAYLAQYDPVTGLTNRNVFWEQMFKFISWAEKKSECVTVIYFHVDQQKNIKDALGQDARNLLRIKSVERISQCLDENTDFSCLGDDEYALIMGAPTTLQDGRELADKLIDIMQGEFDIYGQRIVLDISLGLAAYPEHGSTADAIIKAANIAMFCAREGGANRFLVAHGKMHSQVQDNLDLSRDLIEAMYCNQLELHYQKQVDLHSGSITGFEALLRWNHPLKGFISPAEFIPAAEHTGMINRLGDWVLSETIKQIRLWSSYLLRAEKPVHVAVNLSAIQLRRGGIAERIIYLANRERIPFGCLAVELTESAVLENPAIAVAELRRLRQAGITVAIDDFGTGYSSLNELKRLPIDVLKIDKTFVADIGSDSNDALLTAIVQMAKNLNLTTIAEGVETQFQARYLRELGCNVAQGFLFSTPVAPEKAVGSEENDGFLELKKFFAIMSENPLSSIDK